MGNYSDHKPDLGRSAKGKRTENNRPSLGKTGFSRTEKGKTDLFSGSGKSQQSRVRPGYKKSVAISRFSTDEREYRSENINSHDPYVMRGVSPKISKPVNRDRSTRKITEKPSSVGRANTDALEAQEKDELLLIGKNAVWEALKAGRSIERLFIAQNIDEKSISGILGIASRENVKIERIPKARMLEISGSDKNQGIVAFLSAAEYVPFEELLDNAFAAGRSPVFILLDEVQDPHNLGAVIRTADCAGVSGVVILEHRAVGLTSTVAKVSAGALMHVPVAKVKNLTKAIQVLKERGTRIFGAVMDGVPCYDCDFTDGPIAFVIGNEGMGIRRLVREQCDVLTRIPIYGHVDSLNASVAAAVLMFEAVRQKKQKNDSDIDC